MKNINVKIENAKSFINDKTFKKFIEKAEDNIKLLESKTGKGNEFLGWLDLPYSDEFIEIKRVAKEIRDKAEAVVIVGIGGSYLGAKAVISALKSDFYKGNPEILFAGYNLDASYHKQLLDYLDDKDYSVVVISKSGTTTEPALAFRLLKNHLESKVGKSNSSDRIIAVTDKMRGALKKLAEKEGYRIFVIPDDVGGRFSVLSPVGLLPIAIAGYDIEKILIGAREIDKATKSSVGFGANDVIQYAALRNALYSEGKKIEILTSYQPRLYYFIEWWKQLFGESEGKENKGIFPAGVINITDLHSLGQYIQEGERIIYETVLSVNKDEVSLIVDQDKDNLDNLNYLAGKDFFEINKKAQEGTIMAHIEGGVPVIEIEMEEINEYYLGQLIFFFEKACAVSGYILGVNPFDQPGVEAYKRNMFILLEKPGFSME
ncbi:MAG TPA: glucose-6-phosphate isomerase [Bacteroidetes bacterium]|nr:glucose-6-phosphate isomerase [Bacteroidota bacterium]